MKDLQKSRALQVCRQIIEAYEEAVEAGHHAVDLSDLQETVGIAKSVITRNGLKL